MRPHHLSRAAAVTLVAAAALASACTPAGAAPAPATTPAPPTATAAPTDDGLIGIRLLEAPVNRRDDPRARVYIVDHVAPGTTIKRRIEVAHKPGTDRVQQVPVRVYAAGATVDKGFQFGAGDTANELSSWISVGQKSLSLAPGRSAEMNVQIKVPPKAVAGERYAVIWAQTESVAGGQVRQVNRVGIRVYLDVGPGGEKPSNFDIGKVTGKRDVDGVPRLTAEVRNTGARALDMGGSVALTGGPGGVRAGPFPVAAGVTVGIRQGGVITAALDPRLPDGPWTATITLQSGTVKKARTVRISFPPEPVGESVGGEPPPSRRPWFLVGGAVVLALLVGFLALAARRRRETVPTG